MQIEMTNGESVEFSDTVFAKDYNAPLVHQVVISYQSNGHDGTRANKSRSDVRGGGAKPWRQKGMGRARAGTIRSPIWRGGGVTFAATPHHRSMKVNRKMYRGAMRCIFSELIRTKRLTLVDNFDIDNPKTKQLKDKLTDLNLDETLLILSNPSANVKKAVSNLKQVKLISAQQINPVSLLKYQNVLVDKAVLQSVEGQLA